MILLYISAAIAVVGLFALLALDWHPMPKRAYRIIDRAVNVLIVAMLLCFVAGLVVIL